MVFTAIEISRCGVLRGLGYWGLIYTRGGATQQNSLTQQRSS